MQSRLHKSNPFRVEIGWNLLTPSQKLLRLFEYEFVGLPQAFQAPAENATRQQVGANT